jgi:outer membrane protein OmpA-like peptidoglycan-associated protein
MRTHPTRHRRLLVAIACLAIAACTSPSPPSAGTAPTTAPPLAAVAAANTATAMPAPSAAPAPAGRAALASDLVPPSPVRFEDAVSRAGDGLLSQVAAPLAASRRPLIIDPLIDANTGAQTVSTARMGVQLGAMVRARYANWTVEPFTRRSLEDAPLLLIGTLTPVNVERAVDTPPDAFRVWLTLIDLRTGRVVAKQIDRATVDSVNPEPLKYYSDSPTWHKDKTVLGYINSCQVKTNVGDPADPDYLSRLPAEAAVNEANMAYTDGKVQEAHQLYEQARPLADEGDLRVLNGLYLTNWQLGNRDAARKAFDKLVDSGLEQKRLPLKLLFQPGKTAFNQVGDLPEQYRIWLSSLAQEGAQSNVCIKVVGHTSRTGSARLNEALSRQRAEVVMRMLSQDKRALTGRMTATGVGSKEALVGLGTDDLRDALDRRVEFRVVDCI